MPLPFHQPLKLQSFFQLCLILFLFFDETHFWSKLDQRFPVFRDALFPSFLVTYLGLVLYLLKILPHTNWLFFISVRRAMLERLVPFAVVPHLLVEILKFALFNLVEHLVGKKGLIFDNFLC